MCREELVMLDQNYYPGQQRGVRQLLEQAAFQEHFLQFTGHKSRTKEELQKLMYRKVTPTNQCCGTGYSSGSGSDYDNLSRIRCRLRI
jgi:hypothetical protein